MRYRTSRVLGAAAWFTALCLLWFDVTRSDLAVAFGSAASPRALIATAWGAVAGRIGFQLIEAGFYTLLWRLLDRPIRFGPMFVAIMSLATLDALASVLIRVAGTDSPSMWLAALVGFRALPEAFTREAGLRIAFGGVGILAVLRLIGTAYAQRREGPPWRGALALTFATWLAGRLATWWTTDLMRGMSPLP